MGRAQKLKDIRRDTRAGVQLDELDYLRLVQARGAIDAAMLNGQKVVMEAEQAVKVAREAFVAALGTAAKKYDFDPTRSHRMDDASHRLIPEDPT